MNDNKVFEILNSKWTMLILGIIMTVILPITYGNLIIVYEAGEMANLWWVPVVFIINLITAIMAYYKFTTLLFAKKEVKEW